MIKMTSTDVRTFRRSVIVEPSDCWFAAKLSEKFGASFFGVVHEQPRV